MEALRVARGWRPDLIILDVQVPVLDGITICESLSKNSETSSIPILIITALPGQLSRYIALDAGATACLAKPVVKQALLSRVEEILDRAGLSF